MMKKVLIFLVLLAVPAFGADLNAPGVTVKVEVRDQTKHGQFNDAIYYPMATFLKMTDAQVAADKKARSDNWVSFVDIQSKKPPVVPTKSDLIEQSKSQADQISASIAKFVAAKPTKAEAQVIIDKLKASMDSLGAVVTAKEIIK